MAFMILAALVLLFGVYAYAQQLLEGEVVTGLRDVGTMGGATWGLYIAFAVYFVGVSFAGITVAALIRLFNLDYLKPVSRLAEVLTVIALILGALSILADLGQPLRGVVNLFLYARPQSPFFGTFTLVIAGYLFASLVYLYLDSRRDAALCARVPSRLRWLHRLWAAGYRDTPAERARHRRVSFWLAVAIIPLLVVAHSTLGFVFGLQVGRPGWYSALQAPAFVILAGVSGLGLLILLAAAMRWVLKERERLSPAVFSWMGKFLMVLLLVYFYLLIVELLTSTYAAHHHEVRLTNALLFGEFAWIYWLSVASLAVPLVLLAWQSFTGRWNLPALVVSGVLVNVAAVGKRYLIVVPSQTYGALLPYDVGSYAPTWVEYGTILGLVALGALLLGLFMKVFPILDIPEHPEGGERRRASF
jgi:molybdopterin-containing oxidoreductase family membrane subunit